MIASLALGWTVIYLDRTILYPLLPVIGEEFGLSGAQRGAIASTYFAVYVALQVPSGVIGDRIGLKRVLVAMYLIAGIGVLAVGSLSASYPVLLVFIALHAFGAGAYYSTSYGITVSTVPASRRGISAAIVTSGMAAGLALGLVLGGVLFELWQAWRVPFRVMAVPTMAMALLFIAVIPARTKAPPRAKGSGLATVLANRDLIALSMVGFFATWSQWVVLTWAPSFLYNERGLDLKQSGLYTAVVALPTIVGALAWGRLSDRVGRRRVFVALLPVCALALVGIGLVHGRLGLMASLGLFGLTGALSLNPLMVSWAGDLALHSSRATIGTAIAVMNAFGIASSIVAPIVSGRLLDLTGSLESAFFLAAGFSLVAFLLCWLPREVARP
ncbi:MAG: MFS transporter [Chloroflexi bacterium]|nr:MFS transporter [Chloroflexota bacterium]